MNVHIYERRRGGFKRISCFDVKSPKATVHVLYCGGVHYDALVVHSLRGSATPPTLGQRPLGKRGRCVVQPLFPFLPSSPSPPPLPSAPLER